MTCRNLYSPNVPWHPSYKKEILSAKMTGSCIGQNNSTVLMFIVFKLKISTLLVDTVHFDFVLEFYCSKFISCYKETF